MSSQRSLYKKKIERRDRRELRASQRSAAESTAESVISRRRLRVVLERMDFRPRLSIRQLRVIIERSGIVEAAVVSRQRWNDGNVELASRRGRVVSVTSSNDDNDDDDNVVNNNNNMVVDEGAVVVRPASPAAIPRPIPVVRHPIRDMVIPRKRTLKDGVATAADVLEALCDRPFSCGNFDQICLRCGAKFFEKEPANRQGVRLSCCKNGKYALPPLRCPPEFRRLFTEHTPESTELLRNVRAVNSLFAMASFKTSAPNRMPEGQGHWCFTITGQIYHYTMGIPDTQERNAPRLNQYYFLDVADVMQRRNAFMEDRISINTMRVIETCLRQNNRYIRAFRTMGEVLEEERQRRGRAVNDIVIGFRRAGDMNVRRREYDLPESRSEIAAVFYGTEPPFNVDLKLYPREDGDAVAVGPGVDGTPASRDGGAAPVDVAFRRRHEIKNLHPMCDAMVYPLLFPYGEDGYHMGLVHETHKITMREFYRYRMQVRDAFSLIHNGGKLFQQYLVDAWVRVEADLLWWIRQHQNKFRFVAAKVIQRILNADPQGRNRVGRAIVLPTSFPGGPRNMQRLYLDAMTVVSRHGKPDLFITFTCNPNWPEIRENLEYRQSWENRPDLVCRVFRVKLLEFMDDIVNKQIYGRVLNYHYVIEFQKRGLPHAHIVVTFYACDSIVTVDDVDAIVHATIPDVETQPRLYEAVTRFQVHNPCGRSKPDAPCMQDGRCKKFYPKPYRDETVLHVRDTGRAEYRRPRDGRIINAYGAIITNERIVPYNPYALAKFQTHVNFEVVGSLQSLKYLYKYVTKGGDCTTICEENGGGGNGDGDVAADGGGDGPHRGRRVVNVDEVTNYLDCRYVSAMEAAWHLLEFKMHDRSHSVMVLPVHLAGDYQLAFQQDEDIRNLEERLARGRSKLDAWFALNETDPTARIYRYVEIPEHFTWDNKECTWRRRQQISKQLGCVAEVSPQAGDAELFYLRILLKYVAGATSYEYLRTVNGVLRDTFREACAARNLLRDANAYELCMAEAVAMRHPRKLRRLFALIVCVMEDDQLGNVRGLFDVYKVDMIQDYLRERNVGRVRAVEMCIEDIEVVLRRNKPQLTCAGLGIVVGDDDRRMDDGDVDVEDVVAGGNGLPVPPVGDAGAVGDFVGVYDPANLNLEQKLIFARVIRAVANSVRVAIPDDLYRVLGDDEDVLRVLRDERVGNVFYVDGPGGTGKTYLYNTVLYYVHVVMGLPIGAVAWTGIAANLLIRGTTSHRFFRLPLDISETSTAGWTIEHVESDRLRRTAVIIWDEASMIHRYAVEAVDRYMRDVMGCGFPMGGKCFIFGGDFRQVLPVVVRGHRAAIIDATLKRCSLWEDFERFRLRTNMREIAAVARGRGEGDGVAAVDGGGNAAARRFAELGDRTYGEWLLALGEGKLPYAVFDPRVFVDPAVARNSRIPNDLIVIPKMFHCDSTEALVSFVYGNEFDGSLGGDRAILCPTNAMVNEINARILDALVGEARTYVSFDSIAAEVDDELRIPEDILNNLNIPGLPPHELHLKVGAIVMLLRNLDVDEGLCNGTRMRVVRLGDRLIECEILTGERRGRSILIPQFAMISRDKAIPQPIKRLQFPIRLAYAITINKAQGQTFEKVGICLKRPCFGHGQLYVAFSRVGRAENVRIYIEDGSTQGTFGNRAKVKYTRNVVYHSLLDDVREVVEERRGGEAADVTVPELSPVLRDRDYEIADVVEDDEEYDALLGDINIDLLIRQADNRMYDAVAAAVEDEVANVIDVDDDDAAYVFDMGVFGRVNIVPDRTASQLDRRVSVLDRPGTSGVRPPLDFARRRSSSSSSSS